MVKYKLPATVGGRYVRRKAERQKADPSPTFAKNRRPGFGMTAEARARGSREKQIPHTAKLRRVRNDSTKQGERCRPEGTALHGEQRKKQVLRCTSLEARD